MRGILASLFLFLFVCSTTASGATLKELIKVTEECRKNIDKNVKDYTAVLEKYERGNGKQRILIKVRHSPFSVYLKFLSPKKEFGKEVIYVEGKNSNKLLAHGVGVQRMFGTISLSPSSKMAMVGQRYPLTEIGIKNLLDKLIPAAKQELKVGGCTIRVQDTKVSNRKCTEYIIHNNKPKKHFKFAQVSILVDNEMGIPVRVYAVGWPEDNGVQYIEESYYYSNLKLNQGLSDRDFDIKNKEYEF